MAIDFVSNPGGGFPRLGRLLKLAYLLSQYESSLPAAFSSLESQYQSTLTDVGGTAAIQADAQTRLASQLMSANNFAATLAQNTVVEMVLADVPSMSRSLPLAMKEWIRQMNVQGKTVQKNTITSTVTALPTNIGNGVVIVSDKRGDGLVAENTIPETLRLLCVADSYTGGATQGNESFGLAGQPVTGGIWDYDYPQGSAVALPVASISADMTASAAGTTLTNGNYESWTGVTPALSNWILSVGTWGTDIKQNTANQFRGTYCVEFVQGTGVLTTLYQPFNNSASGTPILPAAGTSYAFNVWLKRLGSITGGILTIELTDQNGTVQNDAQGVPNSTTVTLSALTTSYVATNVVFRLPPNPATILWVRFRISTPLTGADFVMDDATFPPLSSMYTGGPGFVVISGNVPWVFNDGFNIANTNDFGGASNLATFQTGLNRLLNLDSMGLLLPSSGSPNISNTFITS